jgi:hypothetical protein
MNNNTREIKLRVWDKIQNVFINPDQCGFIMRYGLIHGNVKHPVYDLYYNPDVIIQQFTGIKDKNSKEIYEGDIIQALHDYGPAGYHQRTARILWHNTLGYQWHYWNLSTIEIIGNIFQNPNIIIS